MIENIKARIYAKKWCIYTEEIVQNGNQGYFIHNGQIYYGNRFGVFINSGQKIFSHQKYTTLKISDLVRYKGEICIVTKIGKYGIQGVSNNYVINAKFSTPDLTTVDGIPIQTTNK